MNIQVRHTYSDGSWTPWMTYHLNTGQYRAALEVLLGTSPFRPIATSKLTLREGDIKIQYRVAK